ncbi:MAG: DNA polymerase III subunit delta [Lysobacter sp.]|nr:MAG: DNA polymerase III subunit delta [Lysobacter sp.]
MELTPERLIAQLGAEPLRPAYLIAGPEPLRVLEAADAVRAQARAEGIGEREVFDADSRDFDWNQIAQSVSAMSLFASRRLLEVRLPSAKPGKDGSETIVEFCANPPQDVVLLITGDDWSRQHGGKWSEAIARVGHHAIAWALKPHELTDWVERRLRARGLRADRDAVQRLVERVEGNLLAAAQEIDKLVLLSDGDAIDLARMESYVADAARFDVFRLLDATLNGQSAQALRMLHGLRAEGEAVPALMGMVVMELQRAAALARVNAKGGNLAAEFKAQRVWDAKQAVYRRALQRHDAARWERFVAEAGRVDRIAKGRPRIGEEPADAWLALERLLIAVAEPRGGGFLAKSASAGT